MSRLTIGKYKRELQQKLKILKAGSRHEHFDYPTFHDLPKEFQIHPTTPLEVNEMRTAVAYAGDIQRNFVEFYILKKMDWQNDRVECLNPERQNYTFYTDSVAIIPIEIIPPKIKLEVLLRHDDLIQRDKSVRARKKEEQQKQEDKIDEIAKEVQNA